MKNYIFKTLFLIVSIVGLYLLYTISDGLKNNRYQMFNNRVLDTKTGEVYRYLLSNGSYEIYKNGKKLNVKTLPN
ncbi:hypothetical protein [Pedobacter cryophilus]|uniref:Uncharacterized protein n=1 Tax=Pedobacter cryophilus TaxID=2571271 RepID=A0A4U1BZZ7_9SPHI|nr:hypothetical protein [Pedobacter cryophilus]TKB98878.1 hypothetical protein FA046_07120 [Pedobacter cryophilus]